MIEGFSPFAVGILLVYLLLIYVMHASSEAWLFLLPTQICTYLTWLEAGAPVVRTHPGACFIINFTSLSPAFACPSLI